MRGPARLSGFVVLHAAGAVLLYFAWAHGWVDAYVLTDRTFITPGICAVAAMGVISAAFRDWRRVRWFRRRLVELGLLGTVIGFIIALSGVDARTVGDVSAIQPMVGALISGMGVALNTTLVGLVGYLWLALLGFLLAGETDE
jgi:hypothetical protein